jgi:hypothetical protein
MLLLPRHVKCFCSSPSLAPKLGSGIAFAHGAQLNFSDYEDQRIDFFRASFGSDCF